MEPFDESGMTFGPFPSGYCYRIELSGAYQNIMQGVKIAEFLLLRQQHDKPPTIWVVEAKSSTPRPETNPNFQEFIDEICAKLSNAMALCMAIRMNRHPDFTDELPEAFKNIELGTINFRLMLVVNGHHEAWLAPLQEALSKALHPFVKTWSLPGTAVIVLNETMAQKYGLVQQDKPHA